MRRLFGEPGSRRRAWWDLATSVAVVTMVVWVSIPYVGGEGMTWLLLPLFAWAIVVNVIHVRRATRRLREPEP